MGDIKINLKEIVYECVPNQGDSRQVHNLQKPGGQLGGYQLPKNHVLGVIKCTAGPNFFWTSNVAIMVVKHLKNQNTININATTAAARVAY